MAFSFKKFLAGIKLVPKTSSTADSKGDLEVIDSTGKLGYHNGTSVSPVVTESHSATLTNKSIDADSNTITNIDDADIKAGAAIDASKIADGSVSNTEFQYISTVTSNVQDQLDAKALASDLSNHINDTTDAHDASAISITAIPTIAATDVQGALEELQSDIDTVGSDLGAHITDAVDAHDASAISNVPSGNLIATDVQAALNELQSDIDTRALDSALSAHTGASSGVHGVTGSVVGTTDSQTLTNKTITGADFRTPIRSDVKQDTKANLTTYATTASNGQIVFATDTKEMFQVIDGLLESISGAGGVGGVDILFSQDFETAALSDFTQTGLSLSTSSPLHGSVSALLTHQPATSQSFKQVIAVDEKFRSRNMVLELNVKSTASAGNVTISVYDETNSASILSSTQLNLSSDTGGIKDSVSFTIPATCASMSYTITALQEAGSPVTRIDDIICQINTAALLETSVTVPVMTAWQSYTPTFQGFGTPTNVEFEWRQVGENVEIRGKFTSGTSTAVEARVGLPGGLTSAGTGVIPSIQSIGVYFRGASTSSHGGSILIEPSVSYVTLSVSSVFGSTSSNALSKEQGSDILLNGESLSFFASVPCTGLSATQDVAIPLTQSGLIQEADSVLYAAGNAGQALTAYVTSIPFASATLTGSNLAFNSNSFTVLSSGIYSISMSVYGSTTTSAAIEMYVNGTFVSRIGERVSATVHIGNYVGYFNENDVVSFRSSDSFTLLNNSNYHWLSVTKQGSLKQVAVSSDSKITIPTSELRFEGASSRGAVATAIVKFDTLAKIRGDAFTVVSTANDGTYVQMNKAGKLDVNASVDFAGEAACAITKNQTTLTSVPANSEAMTYTFDDPGCPSWTGFVAMGDIIRVAAGATPNANGLNNLNLSFQEQNISVSVTNTLPQFSEDDSSVRVDTANGYGSTATKIRRFSNVRDNVGTDIEYVDSATNGASFTVKSAGIYNISYSDTFNTVSYLGISKNASSLTTNITGTSQAEVLAIGYVDTNTGTDCVSWEGYLSAGDVIRPHTNGVTGTGYALFTISKVGKPNVTGVDVTPFVNVPQPESQSTFSQQASASATSTVSGSLTSDSGGSILSYSSSTGGYTALKRCTVQANYTSVAGGNVAPTPYIRKNGVEVASDIASAATGQRATASWTGVLNAGEYIDAYTVNASSGAQYVSVTATALSDQILTAPETFSTDTAALTYAGSATYTLSTLANAPVGTYITFTYAASTSIRTQTTTRPTQTDADMNTNGILLYTRAYNANSTAAQPAAIAIQIGKGLKGRSIDLYKSIGKVTAGSLDYTFRGNDAIGLNVKEYNEVTGILVLDAGWVPNTSNTSSFFNFSDASAQTSGYLVINASKNPALTGLGLRTVAARAVNTSGQSIATTATLVTWDSAKTFDTHGALNTSTGLFTAPESGYYWFDAQLTYSNDAYTVNQQANVYVYKNGTQYAIGRVRAHTATTLSIMAGISDTVFLAKGDTLSVYGLNEAGPTALYAGASDSHFTIQKVSIGTGN